MSPKSISKSHLDRLIESHNEDVKNNQGGVEPLPDQIIENYPLLFDQATEPLKFGGIFDPTKRYPHEYELSQKVYNILFPEGKYTRDILDLRTNPLNFFRIMPNDLVQELRNADYDGLSAFLPDEVLKNIDLKITSAVESALLVFNVLFADKQPMSKSDLQTAVKDINTNGIETILTTAVLNKLREVNPHSLARYFSGELISAIYRQIGVDYTPQAKRH